MTRKLHQVVAVVAAAAVAIATLGVQIGRVATISEITKDGKPAAKFTLDVYQNYIELIPANVDVDIVATTVFGNKYVSLTSPKNPSPQRITALKLVAIPMKSHCATMPTFPRKARTSLP